VSRLLAELMPGKIGLVLVGAHRDNVRVGEKGC
jgi:hypothetical protein